MKNAKKYLLIPLMCGFIIAQAQDNNTQEEDLQQRISALEINQKANEKGNSSFLLTGFSNLTYHQDLNVKEDSRFAHAGFSPIFLWQPAKKIFFEAELHIELQGGVHGGEIAEGDGHAHGHGGEEAEGHEGITSFDLGYANMVYMIKPNIIFSAGKFLTPVGIYNERYHPTWINPLPVDPYGMGHGGPLPSAELGIQVRGGLYAGTSKFTYAIYVSNGPILDEGSVDSERAGRLVYSNFSDNNGNKAIGGRISYLPFHNGSLEVGLSGQHAGKIGDRGTRFENINADILVFDLTFNKQIGSVGLMRFSGQHATIMVEDVDYQNSLEDIAEGAPIQYSFDNTSIFYYAMMSMRPIQAEKKFIRDSEISFRFESGETPEGSHWYQEEQRILVGYTHWLHARTAFKIATSFGDKDVLYAQFAIGL